MITFSHVAATTVERKGAKLEILFFIKSGVSLSFQN